MPTTNNHSPGTHPSRTDVFTDHSSETSDEESGSDLDSDSDSDLSGSNDPTPVKKNKEQEFSELLGSIGKDNKQLFLSGLNEEQINHLFKKIQTMHNINTLALTFLRATSNHLCASIKRIENSIAAKSIQNFDIGGFTENPIPVIETAITVFKNLKTISCSHCKTLNSPDDLESIAQKNRQITFISIFPPTTKKSPSDNLCTLFNDKRSKPMINERDPMTVAFWPPSAQ